MYGMWTCRGISHMISNPHDVGRWIALELSHLIRQLTTMQMLFQDSESNLNAKAKRSQGEDLLYKHTSPWQLTMRH